MFITCFAFDYLADNIRQDQLLLSHRIMKSTFSNPYHDAAKLEVSRGLEKKRRAKNNDEHFQGDGGNLMKFSTNRRHYPLLQMTSTS